VGNEYFDGEGRSRPKTACHASPNRPVSQSQILQTGGLQSSRWCETANCPFL
ncbi:hypothetical protein, partial [Methylomonas albis]